MVLESACDDAEWPRPVSGEVRWMVTRWRCTQGHEWEPADAADPTPLCPTCGTDGRALGDGSLATIDLPPATDGPYAIAPPPRPDGDTYLPELSHPAAPASGGALKVSVPGYEILGELGRGGMGVVYKARQVGLNRTVALKMVLAAEHAGPEMVQRFRVEAEAIARLAHPNIVQVYEVGEVDGRPYFSLEYVDGGSLAQLLQGQPQPPRVAAGLIETLARAVHVAHEAGVVHRDLKPANILLDVRFSINDFRLNSDGSGTLPRGGLPPPSGNRQSPIGNPKITDFGLAKKLDSGAGQTQSGSIIGTPSYMAPEQAAGQGKRLGPAADVYSLGAILYELITGRPPFRSDTPLDTLLQVLHDEPLPPHRLQPKVPRDLETITLKCLHKEPARRYPSALALADDLRRFLDGEAVTARPATAWERGRRWARHHPTAAGVAAAGALAAVVFVALVLRDRAKLQAEHAQVEAERNKVEAERDNVRGEKQRAMQRLVRLTVANGGQHLNEGDLLLALPWFAEALRQEQDDPGRAAMHRVRLAAVLRQCPRLVHAWFHDAPVNAAAFTPDARQVLTAGEDGVARLRFLPGREPDGGAAGAEFDHGRPVRLAELRRDGRQLLTVDDEGVARFWEVPDGEVRALPPTGVLHAAYSADGSRVLTAGADRTARVWDAATGKAIGPPLRHAADVRQAAFSPDGAWVATASGDRTAVVWDAATGLPLAAPMPHDGAVRSVAFSPDGQRLVTASDDHTARVWDVSTGEPVTPPLRHAGPVAAASFSPDGTAVVTASDDHTARVWDARTGTPLTAALSHGSEVLHAAFSPEGRRVVTASDDNTARVWDVTTGRPITPPLRHNGTVRRAVFGPNGRAVLTASQDGVVRIWVVADDSPGDPAGGPRDAPRAVFGPDGRRKLRINGDNTARVHDSGTDEPLTPLLRHDGPVTHAAFSPDGSRVLTTSADRTAQVWDAATGAAVGARLRHGSDVVHGSFSPDGRRVVTASVDNTARVWDAATGEPVAPPLRQPGSVTRAVFSPDGRCVLTAGHDGTARAWDADTGEPLAPPLPSAGWVRQALADDGRTWDLPPDARPVDELVRLAQWLSGHRIDQTGSLVPLGPDELRRDLEALRVAAPSEFRVVEERIREWHRRESAAAESARQWFAAAFHLDRLLDYEPRQPDHLIRRGRALAEQQLWVRAADDFAQALALGADDPAVRAAAALTRLAAGDRNGYRQACQGIRERWSASAHGEPAQRLAWACLVAPDGTPDAGAAQEWVKRLTSHTPDRPELAALRGAALVRAGRWDEAAAVLRAAQPPSRADDAARADLLLALIHHARGQDGEARSYLERADRRLEHRPDEDGDPHAWLRRLEVRLLRAEVVRQMTAPTADRR
jgi:WD40 repeat protein/serine/threonine protein kinase/tetratricopeptide (TPR) repeat protein